MGYWTAVRSELSRERVAERFLTMAGYTTYFPKIQEQRINCGRKILVARWLFPNYLFIRIEMDIPAEINGAENGARNGHDTPVIGWWTAKRTCGVSSLVMDGISPARISDKIIDEIKSRERNGFIRLPTCPEFVSGDPIKVVAGPFSGQLGLYEGQKGSARVLVLLRMFGSQQRTELRRDAIEAVAV
jgi:transcription antitermination factor NusG